jgi:hypothetical protein
MLKSIGLNDFYETNLYGGGGNWIKQTATPSNGVSRTDIHYYQDNPAISINKLSNGTKTIGFNCNNLLLNGEDLVTKIVQQVLAQI